MEGGSNAEWAAGRDASAVAMDLKRELVSAADEVWHRGKQVVDYEAAHDRRQDVIQAAMVWGAVAFTFARGIHELEPKIPEGLYPGEGFCDATKVVGDEEETA